MDATIKLDSPSDQKPVESSATVHSLTFIKRCARKEGIALNDRIWTRVEEVIAANSKWSGSG